LAATVTNQNYIYEEIRIRLNSRNACCYSVQNLLSSSLLSKNLKIKIYRTIILSVVLYGCKTWSLTLWEEHSLKVFENRVPHAVTREKNSPTVAHAYHKRRLKWVLGAWGYNWATQSPGDINMEICSSRLGVGRGDAPTPEKVNS
jgi:hypothetical protein